MTHQTQRAGIELQDVAIRLPGGRQLAEVDDLEVGDGDQLIVTGRRAASKGDLDLLRLGRRAHGVERCLDDRGEVRRTNREPQLSGDDPGDVQKIVDQFRLRQHVALDDLEAPGRPRRVGASGPQRAGPPEDRGQRGSQLV